MDTNFLAAAGLACGLLSMAACSAPEPPEPAAAPAVAPAQEPAPANFHDYLHLLADDAGMQETPHRVVNVVYDDAATEAAPNTLVVQGGGSFKFQFDASTEAEGRELLGFFARAALHGLEDAEQNTSLNVRHQAPAPATL